MYNRVVRVSIGDSLDDPFFVTEKLRVEFDQTVNFASSLTKTKVTIYNLSTERVKAISRANRQPQGENPGEATPVFIRLQAGYEDESEEIPTIVEGVIISTTFKRALPENSLTLYIMPQVFKNLTRTFEPIAPFKKPDRSDAITLRDGLSQMLTAVGVAHRIKLSQDELAVKMTSVIAPGKYGALSTLKEMAGIYKFQFITTRVGVEIVPMLDDTGVANKSITELIDQGSVVPVHPQRVRGTPVLGIATIELSLALDGSIEAGHVLDVINIIGAPIGASNENSRPLSPGGIVDRSGLKDLMFWNDGITKYSTSQYYYISNVRHQGDTHDPATWTTTILGLIQVRGSSGEIEIFGSLAHNRG